ncbi:3406_t:CDS:2 [Dentiscutata erythropus]|uniref:3406_t:CDS:1 n=1 Tax=Dentiscutata erythropus TaxID=1348616 RepID=A0A9N9JJB7_9GLOM|nr:3406_t:CDS:2 [Dentiscutata erythropus]
MTRLTQEEYQRIKDIKILDLEICDYQHINILNLGWEVWGKWYCLKHEREHVLCPKLCLPRIEEPVKPNRPYDWANCYLCGKELEGAIVIRYCVWNVLEKSFIREWWGGRGRSGGSIGGGADSFI